MSEISTSNVQAFKIAPDHEGGTVKTVTINPGNISPAKKNGKKWADPDAHLLIGFDTEYQTIAPVNVREVRNQTNDAKNEVLSYQFCVKLVSTVEVGEQSLEVSGIVIPEADQQLAIEQFIAFAIGTWMAGYPDVKIPDSVYLIGHFTRADLPAFDEFQNDIREITSNVRNTFVSIDSHLKFRIVDQMSEHGANLKVRIRDTLLLAPANAKSLSDIGDIVGFQKIRLADDVRQEISIKEDMKKLRADNWTLFRDYAIRDAEVCVRYAERILRQHYDLFADFKLPVTLTSFGTKLVLKDWSAEGLDPNQVLGRETVSEKKFVKKLGYSVTKESNPFLDEVFWQLDFVTAAYHGGRNEQFIYGVPDEGDWRDLDISSAYTTAMSMIGLPDWTTIEQVDGIDSIMFDELAFCSVDFEFPDHIRFPTLPVRTQNGIIFPRSGTSVCPAPEIWLARELGANLKLRVGKRVSADRSRPIFQNFIKGSIQQRNQHKKGSLENLFWKEVGNSTYGKTAQGMRKKRVYDLKADDMVELPESQLTQPFFAAFITSFTRALLGEILNALPTDVKVFSVTTDGFLSTASQRDIDAAMAKPLAMEFQRARRNLVGDDCVLEQKHAIRRPIGWRTRGSATVVPGDGDSGNIVLQKGGIKTKQLLEGELENQHIVELFLDRQPDQMIEYTIGLGIRDMVTHDADFVSRNVEKHLRMEFDWKRTPTNVREVTFEFNGRTFTHVTFDTVPIDNLDQFQNYRTAWDDYNKKTRCCIKTEADFLQFWAYVETKKMPKSITSYLSRKNGDLKRLKRDLCRAMKSRQAGFDKVFSRCGKLTHEMFCDALHQCGIPCTIDDLDYANLCTFTPRQCVNTVTARQAIEKLRDTFYPELEIELFFPE